MKIPAEVPELKKGRFLSETNRGFFLGICLVRVPELFL